MVSGTASATVRYAEHSTNRGHPVARRNACPGPAAGMGEPNRLYCTPASRRMSDKTRGSPLQPAAVIRILKPNVTSLGYALFLAINAAGVWGGVFPFLPLEFQTPEIVFWFFLAQSLVFSASYFASAFGVYFLPGPTRRFMVMLAAAPYFLGWCCLIAAIYLDAWALPLVVVGGGLLGLGSAGFFMLWQRLFASFDADHGNRDLIVGTAYAAVMYFALYLITAGGDGLPHTACVPAAVRPGHCFEKPRDRPRPAHVRGRAARPPARVPHRGARLLAQRVLRGSARVLHGHHALVGHRRTAGGSARERAVHGRLARGGGHGAGAVAVQEPAHERGGRLPRGVPVRHHVVSAAAVPHGGVCRSGSRPSCTPCTAWPSCS